MTQKKLVEEREKLKSWLKHGDIRAIADACEVHREVVYKWFSGSENPAIELVVNRIVQMRKDQAESAAEKVVNQ